MPHSASPKLKQFARRLLAHEAALRKGEAKHSAAFHVCEKLRGPLGKLMGLDGFKALLSRALAMACGEAPWLCGLHVKPDASLAGLDELEKPLKAGAIADGEVILVAQLLGLLVTFIGAELTLRFVRDGWPHLEDLNF